MKRRQSFAYLVSAALLGVSKPLGVKVDPPTVEAILIREAGRIGDDIHRHVGVSPWLAENYEGPASAITVK